MACIQETRQKGSGCKLYGAIGKRYKMGGDERYDGVGVFVAEKWMDSAVSVKMYSKRVLILKMVLDNGLLNILAVYAPHSQKPGEEKESFGMKCSIWQDVYLRTKWLC